MRKGKVLWFNSEKGFGVIVDDQGKSYFAHFSEIKTSKRAAKYKILVEQSAVKFTPTYDETRFNIPRAKDISEV